MNVLEGRVPRRQQRVGSNRIGRARTEHVIAETQVIIVDRVCRHIIQGWNVRHDLALFQTAVRGKAQMIRQDSGNIRLDTIDMNARYVGDATFEGINVLGLELIIMIDIEYFAIFNYAILCKIF